MKATLLDAFKVLLVLPDDCCCILLMLKFQILQQLRFLFFHEGLVLSFHNQNQKLHLIFKIDAIFS
jgi:hypothetical protein